MLQEKLSMKLKTYLENTVENSNMEKVYDLKEQGHDIKSYHIKGSTWAYQLILKTKFKKRK